MDKYFSYIVIGIGIVVTLTNVIVEVLKQFIPDEKFKTNWLAVIVSLVLAIIGTFIFCVQYGVEITWIVVVVSIILGFLCAYGSMVGYDKVIVLLKENFAKKQS